jgi:hypothetical protein
VKIGVIATDVLQQGKANIIDAPRQGVETDVQFPKEVYIQARSSGMKANCSNATGSLPGGQKARPDRADMEFVETRLSRNPPEAEKAILIKFKDQLDNEGLLCDVQLSAEEKELISGIPC